MFRATMTTAAIIAIAALHGQLNEMLAQSFGCFEEIEWIALAILRHAFLAGAQFVLESLCGDPIYCPRLQQVVESLGPVLRVLAHQA